MHRQIVQALGKKDAGLAQRLLEEHIDHAKHDLLQFEPEKAKDEGETRRSYAS